MDSNILYVSDLDGTLLNRQDRISDFTLSVINRLAGEGMAFTYATARSLSSASVVTKGLTVNLPAIVYNGVFVKNTRSGEILFSNTFQQDEAEYAVKLIKSEKACPLVYSMIDGQERVSYLAGRENDGIRRYLSLRRGDKRFRPLADADKLYEGDIFYFTLIGEREELRGIYDRFKDHPSYHCILQQELYREEYWCEIMPVRATKANAVLQLKDFLGCGKIVSFGDALNDIPMFDISDACYAVENAAAELKEKASGIIGSIEMDGVAQWLLCHV